MREALVFVLRIREKPTRNFRMKSSVRRKVRVPIGGKVEHRATNDGGQQPARRDPRLVLRL